MAHIFENYNAGDDAAAVIYDATWEAQTFTPSTTHVITSVKLLLKRTGSPGTHTVDIKATDGDGKPTGSALATGTTDGNTLTTATAGEWREITFGAGTTLTASTKYAIVCHNSGADLSNNVAWRADSTSPSYSGGSISESYNSGSTWTNDTGTDFMFEEWGYVQYSVSASLSLGFAATATRAIAVSRTASLAYSFAVTVTTDVNAGGFLCIASQDNNSIKCSDGIGTTWSNCAVDAGGALPASYFAQYLNRLCVINFQNMGFSYSSVNDIITNWTEKPNFPNLASRFTGMFVGKDASDDPALYFLTPQGMYYLDVFTNFTFGPTEVTWEEDSTSGKKGLYWKGDTYVAVGKGIYKISQGTVSLVGPDQDDGLPEDMQGTVTDMIGVGFWLVIAVDGGSGNKSSILKRYITGKHWHPVYVGSVNTPIRTLLWDSGTLYFGEGTSVKSMPFPNQTENQAKLSTYTYGASGDLIYPWFGSEFEAMPKVAHKLRAVTQNCTADESITISYRKDSETSWTSLGSFATSPRPTALPFPASGNAIGVAFERIQFKASFARGATTTNSPKLESLILEYRVTPPVLWGWDFKVKAVTQGDKRGQDIIDALRTAIESGTLLSFYPSGDKSKDQYFVEVAQMPGTEKGTEFGAEGIYLLSVQEVID